MSGFLQKPSIKIAFEIGVFQFKNFSRENIYTSCNGNGARLFGLLFYKVERKSSWNLQKASKKSQKIQTDKENCSKSGYKAFQVRIIGQK